MALFVQESPTRIRIVNPRWINLSAYGSTSPLSVENATPLHGSVGLGYSGWGYDENLQQTQNWIIASFFSGVGSLNGGNAGGPAQDIFVNLQPGRYYYFKAFAFGSNVAEVFELDTRGSTAPWEPGNLMINNASWDYPTLTWISNSTDHTGFEILREKETTPGSGTWGSPVTFAVGPTILTYKDSSVGTGNYRYSVRAVNSFGQSPYCSTRATGNITTAFPTTAPAAPSNVNVVISGTPLSCTLSWTDNSTNEGMFVVSRQYLSGSSWIEDATTNVAANAGSPQLQGWYPTTNGTYRFVVTAVNAAGSSVGVASNTFNVGGSVTLPTAPSNCIATAGASAITVTWTDNSTNETAFEVHRQTLSGTTWGSDISINVSAGATSYVDSNVTANTYRYQVRATNSAGPSAYTAYSQATFTPAPSVPNAPSNLTATDTGIQSVNLAWTDNSNNELRFEIARQVQSGTTWSASTIITTAANATTYQDPSLTPATYRYQIRAVNDVGASAYTAWVTVTVASAPTVPVNAFLGQYYSGMNFATLLGNRTDPAINFNWASNPPMTGVPADLFSVRWTGDWDFTGGTYTFTATTDDGMRVYVDGTLIIDQWIDQAPTTYTANKDISAGRHRIVVEYYENAGGAVAQVSWQAVATVPAAPSNLSATIV